MGQIRRTHVDSFRKTLALGPSGAIVNLMNGKLIADYSSIETFRAPRLEYTTPAGFRNGGRILAIYEDVVDFVPDGGEYRELTFCINEVRFVGAQETPANSADWT